MNQKETDEYYLKMAEVCSKNSKARRLQVGAIIAKGNQIISDGFNGTPAGFDNNCENEIYCADINNDKCMKCAECNKFANFIDMPNPCKDCENALIKLKTKPEVLHAESNAITKCAKLGVSSENGTIYITHSPCVECSKLIIQAGIKRVVYRNLYRSEDGINLLKKANINVEHIKES